jgi:hypothetical protein
MAKNKISWLRLAWLVFLDIYCAIFFYNFLYPFSKWPTTYIATILIVLWLSIEYYQKRLFFQTGFFKFNKPAIVLRSLFGLYFYSLFVVGNGTLPWWPANRVRLYPYFEIVGIIMIIYAIVNRLILNRETRISAAIIRKFYGNLALLIIAMAAGYGSLIMVISLIIGLPLVYGQYLVEISQFNRTEAEREKKSDVV